MKVRRPFSDTDVPRQTVLRVTPALDGRTVMVTLKGTSHVLRRVDLLRLYRWLGDVLEVTPEARPAGAGDVHRATD
jgi:hypothetical protein